VLAIGIGEDRHLAAVVVPDGAVDVGAVRDFARAALPDHMVPTLLVFVDEMPSNDHGKRDWSAIARIVEDDRRRRERYTAPATDDEHYLVRLWSDLLHVEQVSATDDFFELGGHSLLAFRAFRRIYRDLGVEIDLDRLLVTGRLRDVAALVRAARSDSPP
jgi:hypothetical protein